MQNIKTLRLSSFRISVHEKHEQFQIDIALQLAKDALQLLITFTSNANRFWICATQFILHAKLQYLWLYEREI